MIEDCMSLPLLLGSDIDLHVALVPVEKRNSCFAEHAAHSLPVALLMVA